MNFKMSRKVVACTIGIGSALVYYYWPSLPSKLVKIFQSKIVKPESPPQDGNLEVFQDNNEDVPKWYSIEKPKSNRVFIVYCRKIVNFCKKNKVVIIVACVIGVGLIIYIKFYGAQRELPYVIFGGLRNNSNFCYMNSMIQAVASNRVFLGDLEQIQRNISAINNENNMQLYSFIDLLQAINTPGSNAVENTNKLELLMTQINWTKPDQQDAYELLSYLINTTEKNIKFHEKIVMPLKLEMMHVFSGINIPNKTQFHLGLSIGLCGDYNKYPGVTLNYLVDQYFAPTIIDDDPNKTSNLLFSGQPPNLLLLHIQANKWSNERREMIKPEYHIQYEKYLEFNAKCYNNEKYEQENVDVRYKLTAIVHHMGTISGGHYVTYRIWKDNWYLINDEEVSPIDFNCEICPYILLYEKV